MAEAVLLYGADGTALVGTKGAKYPDLPLGSYFFNAGLSYTEAIAASGACLARVKQLLAAHLRDLEIREPGAARKYATDWQMRHDLNRKLIAAALLEMGFNTTELREIDKGLGLELATKEKQPALARTVGPDGREEVFEVERVERRTGYEHGVVLHSKTTGIHWH